jgi:hypothetical protein
MALLLTAKAWKANTEFSAGDVMQGPGCLYVCTVGGKTGKKEPKYPTAAGGTVVDGAVTWTARAVPGPVDKPAEKPDVKPAPPAAAVKPTEPAKPSIASKPA